MSEKKSRIIEKSTSVREACERFMGDVGEWANECRTELAGKPVTDGHDQGTFTTPWASYIVTADDVALLAFLKEMRDKIRDHMIVSGLWSHGYWRRQEAHHGTEHFELFLGTLWELDPDDGATIEQMADAAEHLGNWEPAVAPWFDWDTGLFLSTHFGTDGVEPMMGGVNIADHFRCVSIALRAADMTGDTRYMDLARAHARRWAEAILAGDDMPLGIGKGGAIYGQDDLGDAGKRWFAGQAVVGSTVDRTENLVASGAVDSLLDVAERADEPQCRQAAVRLLDVAAGELTDPDAGCAADVIAAYRARTGDTRYDTRLRELAESLEPCGFSELALAPNPPKYEKRPSGFGKRGDKPDWLEDGRPRRHNPVTLACLAEAMGDEAMAMRAVDIGRAAFALAREVYPSGNHHGCSARTVSAIARGHGRENHAGVVTACLDRVMAGWGK